MCSRETFIHRSVQHFGTIELRAHPPIFDQIIVLQPCDWMADEVTIATELSMFPKHHRRTRRQFELLCDTARSRKELASAMIAQVGRVCLADF